MKSVVEVDFSFRKFFTVKSAFIEVIARNLRNSYTNYQTTISQFPIDKLSANNRKSFDNMISSVEFWLERGVSTAEVTALNYIWTAHPNTGIRGPTTPSETHLEQSLKPSLLTLKLTISESDDACLEPFIPLIIPSYQPFTDAINFAATDQIKTINNITFKSSLESETASVEATKDLIEILNKCGSTTSTDSCIGNFVRFLIQFYLYSLKVNFISDSWQHQLIALTADSAIPLVAQVLSCQWTPQESQVRTTEPCKMLL